MNKRSIAAFLLTVSIVLTSTTQTFALTSKYTTTRIGGTDRFDIAIGVSKEFAKNDTITNCIVDSCNDYADNISAVPLSVYENAPILLTEQASLNPKTQQRLSDMGIKNVFIVGGVGAVSQKVENQLNALGYKVTRLGGTDRYATNKAVMNFIPRELWGPHPKIVNGYDCAQGLTVAVDTKYYYQGKTYINPILMVDKDTYTPKGLKDIYDMLNPVRDSWYNLNVYEPFMDGHIYNNIHYNSKDEAAADIAIFNPFKSNKVGYIYFNLYPKYYLWNENTNLTINADYSKSIFHQNVAPYQKHSVLMVDPYTIVDSMTATSLSAKYVEPIVMIDPNAYLSIDSSITPAERNKYFSSVYDNINSVFYIGNDAYSNGKLRIKDGIEKYLTGNEPQN